MIKSLLLSGAPETLPLAPGLYLVELPEAGLRQGFEVLKPMTLTITEPGPPVVEAETGTLFDLEIDPNDPTAAIFVIDSRFSLAESDCGRLAARLPFGLFKVKTRVGRSTSEQVILLDRDGPPISASRPPLAATAAPIAGTAAVHEYHLAGRDEAIAAANALAVAAGRAVLMLIARAYSGEDAPVPGTRPWQGISVVDADGRTVIDLAQQGELRALDRDPLAFAAVAIDPGCYFLRQQLSDGATLEESLIAAPGWRLEVYVLRRVPESDHEFAYRPRVSLMMHRLGADAGSEDQNRLVETARIALADERSILNAELEGILLHKFENPWTGIIGGHLLLVERERDPGRDIGLLDTVVWNLHSLVGSAHPDVAALALQCSDPRLRRTVPALAGPPMLQRSWKLLAAAAHARPELIPAQMFARLQALTTLPPFLVWVTDEDVKQQAQRELATAIMGAPPARAARVADAAAAAPPVFSARHFAQPTLAPVVADAVAAALERTPETDRRLAQLSLPPSALDVVMKSSG